MKQTCGALVLVTRYYLARRAARESPNRMQVRSLQYFSIVGLPSKNKSISQFHSMWILKELPIASTMFSSRFLPLLFRVSEKEVLKTHEESQCICLVNLTFGKSSKHIHLMHPVFFPTKSPKRSHTLLGGYLRNQQTTSHDSIQKSREKKKNRRQTRIMMKHHSTKSWKQIMKHKIQWYTNFDVEKQLIQLSGIDRNDRRHTIQCTTDLGRPESSLATLKSWLFNRNWSTGLQVEPGKPGAEVSKNKNYKSKKVFAYRMCTGWPTTAMPKPSCLSERAFSRSMVVMWWPVLMWLVAGSDEVMRLVVRWCEVR